MPQCSSAKMGTDVSSVGNKAAGELPKGTFVPLPQRKAKQLLWGYRDLQREDSLQEALLGRGRHAWMQFRDIIYGRRK